MTQHSQTIVLAFNPTLAAHIGLNEAILLNQMAYWLSKTKHFIQGRPWVYNSYKEWEKQFPFWSKSTIKRLILSLETKGLILSQNLNAKKTNRTKWYSLDFEKIPDLTPQHGASQTLDSGEKEETFSSVQNEILDGVKLTPSIKQKNTLQMMKERVVGKFANNPANLNLGVQRKKSFDQWQLSEEERLETIGKMNWDGEKISSELLRFQTYYSAKAGLAKRDWDTVWRMWCARAQTFAMEREQRGEDAFASGKKLNDRSSEHYLDSAQAQVCEKELSKILEQEINQKISLLNQRERELSQNKNETAVSTEAVWLDASKTLIKQVGAGAYTSWLKDIDVHTSPNKVIVLKAKSRFFADYISIHLLDKIKNAFESVLSGNVNVSVVA